jgi:NitT/TauT family transport system substrate-binding protein
MKKISAFFLLVIFLSACAAPSTNPTSTPPSLQTSSPTQLAVSPIAPETSTALVTIRLPVGYIPNVQFAPLYVAIDKSFYTDLGLQVIIDYNTEIDSVALVGAGELQFAIVSGEQVLLGRAQELPIVYVMNWYNKFPVGIAALKSAGISQPADLKGKKIGTPVLYGASYIGLTALLKAGGLTTSDVTLDTIGFTQIESLTTKLDDAVVIYGPNEPVQLRALGYDITELKVSDYLELVGNGLITNEKYIQVHPEIVRKMVSATIKGIQYTIDHPDEAYQISMRYVENLAQADQAVQKQVLTRSIELWKNTPPGFSNPTAWQNMAQLLLDMGLIKTMPDVNLAFRNDFLP